MQTRIDRVSLNIIVKNSLDARISWDLFKEQVGNEIKTNELHGYQVPAHVEIQITGLRVRDVNCRGQCE